MTTAARTARRLAAAMAAAVCLLAGRAAAEPREARLNVEVEILSNLSVSVNAAASSTQTVSWDASVANQILVAAATSTVLNDSGAQTEKWALSTNANSLSQGTGGTWALAASSTSVGVDAFALQAVFGSKNTTSCLAAGAATWNDGARAPLLTTTPTTYTSTTFAAAALNEGGSYQPDVPDGPHEGRMHAGGRRALCWRIIAPQSTGTVDAQNIQIIITAQSP